MTRVEVRSVKPKVLAVSAVTETLCLLRRKRNWNRNLCRNCDYYQFRHRNRNFGRPLACACGLFSERRADGHGTGAAGASVWVMLLIERAGVGRASGWLLAAGRRQTRPLTTHRWPASLRLHRRFHLLGLVFQQDRLHVPTARHFTYSKEIRHSTALSRLKTHLLHKSFPP